MLKKSLLFALAALLVMGTVVFALEDTEKHKACPLCGMDRERFAHSRILIEYEDGTSFGACSLHCAAIELATQMGKMPKMIGVGDYGTKKLIDAEKAFWVLGGGKSGVMTKRAKWAFEKKADAEKFVADNGGSLISFDQALKAAYEDMYADTKMIREKRKMMKMQH